MPVIMTDTRRHFWFSKSAMQKRGGVVAVVHATIPIRVYVATVDT